MLYIILFLIYFSMKYIEIRKKPMRIIFTKYHKLREIEKNCLDDSTSFYNVVSSFSSAKKEKNIYIEN